MLKLLQLSIILFLCTNLVSAQGLVINEFVASSDSLSMLPDEFDEYDDWVELHNNSGQNIDLSGYHLSDNLGQPDKWTFPAGVNIEANGYLIVWTDDDDEQGDLHTNYKLNKGGEELILSDPNLVVLDSLTYGPQETNVSMARIPNGTGNFVPRAPTFNDNNEVLNTIGLSIRKDIKLFPNPVLTRVYIELPEDATLTSGIAELSLTDNQGRLVLIRKIENLTGDLYLDMTTIPAGIYTLHLKTDRELYLQQLILQAHD